MIDPRVCICTVGRYKFTGLRVQFEVEKTLAPKPNIAKMVLWNLKRDTRKSLEDLAHGFAVPGVTIAPQPISVRLEAGYTYAGTSQIFLGQLRTCVSIHEGVDHTTTLTTGDGERELQTAVLDNSLGAGASIDSALLAVAKSLKLANAEREAAKCAQIVKAKGKGSLAVGGLALTGNTAEWLTDFCRSADLEWSVQDGQLQILDRGKALAEQSYFLSAETGLMGTPSVDQEGVCVFETRMLSDMRPGRVVNLSSEHVSGGYKIQKSKWLGDTHGQDWKVSCEAVRY